MFREMRRKRQAVPLCQMRTILAEGSHGVLSLSGDGGYPYGVPLSYMFDGNRIIFHSAREGHKIDAIRRNPKASFCVVGKDQVVASRYTSYFRSVIVFGTIRFLESDEEKLDAINKLAMKYAPSDTEENRMEHIRKDWSPLCMFVLEIEHMTGKEAIELARERS